MPYPPGAKNDPRAPYNQPDRSHDHEWVPNHRMEDGFLIEDGRVIWSVVCEWYDGEYECDERDSYSFKATTITIEGETYKMPDVDNRMDFEDGSFNRRLIDEYDRVIRAYIYNRDGMNVLAVDPDPDTGSVKIEFDGVIVRFDAEDDNNISLIV